MAQERPPTTDELHRAIDSGATGENVEFPGPVAAVHPQPEQRSKKASSPVE